MTAILPNQSTKLAAQPTAPVTRDMYAAFLSHATTSLNALMLRLGKQGFSAADLAGLHPSLLRDLQPHQGQATSDAIINLFTVPEDAGWLRRQVVQHRVRRARKVFAPTAAFFERNTPTALDDTAYATYDARMKRMKTLTDIFWTSELPSRFNMHVESELDATSIIQFLYLPQAFEAAIDALTRYGSEYETVEDLIKHRQAFDKFHKVLCSLVPKSKPAPASTATP